MLRLRSFCRTCKVKTSKCAILVLKMLLISRFILELSVFKEINLKYLHSLKLWALKVLSGCKNNELGQENTYS